MSNQSSRIRQLNSVVDEMLALAEEYGFNISDLNRKTVGDMKRIVDLLRDLSDTELFDAGQMFRESLSEDRGE